MLYAPPNRPSLCTKRRSLADEVGSRLVEMPRLLLLCIVYRLAHYYIQVPRCSPPHFIPLPDR